MPLSGNGPPRKIPRTTRTCSGCAGRMMECGRRSTSPMAPWNLSDEDQRTATACQRPYPSDSASPNPTSICPSCTISPAAQDTEATTVSAGADSRNTVFIASSTTSTCPRVTLSPHRRQNLRHQPGNRRDQTIADVFLVIPRRQRVRQRQPPRQPRVPQRHHVVVHHRADRPPNPIQRHPKPSRAGVLRRAQNIANTPARPVTPHRHRISRFSISKAKFSHRRGIQPPQITLIPRIAASTAVFPPPEPSAPRSPAHPAAASSAPPAASRSPAQ